MDNVYLIGLMGCGKSSLGFLLAKRLHRRNVDTDILIEKKAGKTVKEIFALYGEDYFRELETEVLKELAQRRNFVVSCGGGIVLREENVALMRSSGLVLWLRRDPDKILQGKRIALRPLLAKDPRQIYRLEEERRPLYEKACHLEIRNEEEKEKTVQALLRAVRRSKKIRSAFVEKA